MAFDPNAALMGLAGGLMIGVAAAMMLLLLGRIAGISGLLGGLLAPSSTGGRWAENLAFVVGIVGVPALLALAGRAPELGVTTQPVLLIAGGLLVGFGTRLGNGCTSGHGVCGLSRFSLRSLAATLAFMAVGVGAATLVRPVVLSWVGG